ncbi:hypothetical protein BJ742DRAFT_832662 [Cladochytrium replicatum]|nr:hypothetical protein BJ742DRAFT_832662 [Cladochytrium replicatum]
MALCLFMMESSCPSVSLQPNPSAISRTHIATQSASTSQTMRELVPHAHRTRLMPLWHIPGWALTALLHLVGGPPAVYRTIHHVEEFVDKHYQEQIDGIDAYRRSRVRSVDKEEYKCESLEILWKKSVGRG